MESEPAVSDRNGFDDGNPSPISGLPSFRLTALRDQNGAQPQHGEALIDLCRGQPWIERNRGAAAGDCHNGENRLRTVRHEHPDPGAAIEPTQTQLPADFVRPALKIAVR